jgi:hypothetical protein
VSTEQSPSPPVRRPKGSSLGGMEAHRCDREETGGGELHDCCNLCF